MSRVSLNLVSLVLTVSIVCGARLLHAQTREDSTVRASATVLDEIMAIPAKGIPSSMLAKAEGVVIIPSMIKGGFVVGVRHGRGVAIIRDENRNWQPPQFITMTGGSVGWQAGIQATDVVLVFQTRSSVQGLLNGKFTVGVDAAASAGPVGRQASAGTDITLKSEIYSYNRSRGLFVGASVDGSSLQIDPLANQRYYAHTGLSPMGQQTINTPVLPESAALLLAALSRYADGAGLEAASGTAQEPALSTSPVPVDEAPALGVDQIRMELAAAYNRLEVVLDDNWKRYLQLPPAIFQQNAHPSPNALQSVIGHYDAIVGQSQYSALTQRTDYQHVHGLLHAYADALARLAAENGAIQLPPPPQINNPTNR